MFGAIIFLPVYLQIAQGVSPTISGLMLLPLMVGLLGASIGSGRAISKMGRYKIFPIIGTGIVVVAMFLLSKLTLDTSLGVISLFIFILGVGIGLVMQVVVLATQNSVEMKDMGVATSSSTFFRSLGGTFGTAIFGSILTSRLVAHLGEMLPPSALHGINPSQLTGSPQAILQLPAAIGDVVRQAYVLSLNTVFRFAIPVAFIAFVLTWFLKEVSLRGRAESPSSEEAVPMSEPAL